MNGDLSHGGALDLVAQQFPQARQPWVDLSTGINPWPWPVGPLDPAVFSQLPTRAQIERCKRAMGSVYGTQSETLTLVPGTELAIRLLPSLLKQADAREPATVSVLTPSYSDHAQSWRAAGAAVTETTDPLAASGSADVVVVCNPNNPDGQQFSTDRLIRSLRAQQQRNGWLIVDEAFVELSPELSLTAHAGTPGLIVLRSFGKFFGLAGLRLGAVLAPAPLLASLDQALGFWRVSGPALHIGADAYAALEWHQQTRARLAKARQALDAALHDRGIDVVGGTDLFRMIRVADAHTTWTRLCEGGIYTRRFPWTHELLRIGLPRSAEDRQRLIARLLLKNER
ncbi:MAG: threonine-phosphate decarboxylase CobD [Pseudomonadota bacterium]